MATALQLATTCICLAFASQLLPAASFHMSTGEFGGGSSSAALTAQRADTNGTKGGVKVDLYVINLNDRPERCDCIAKQLEHLDLDMYRQEGQVGNTCGVSPSKSDIAKKDKASAEAGLFCSNYRIWKSAIQRNADFIIILEDDAVFSDGWMPKVQAMLNSCQQVDYIAVDPVWWGSALKPVSVEGCSAAPSLLLPVPDAWGTTMQIIRTGFLPKMIEAANTHGWGAMDIWYKNYPIGHQAYLWQPHIVQQSSHQSWALPGYCSKEAKRSDIANNINLIEQSVGRLWCPHHE